jgi:hypothetical protein
MSNERIEDLVDGVPSTSALAELVENHLDEHPLPVSEDEVQAVVARLEQRMAPARRTVVGWRAVAAVTLLAAVGLMAARLAGPTLLSSPAPGPTDSLTPAVVPAPVVMAAVEDGRVHFRKVQRTVHQAPDTALLRSEDATAAAFLVRSGSVLVGDQLVEAGEWVVMAPPAANLPDHIFADGTVPSLTTWDETTAAEQLQDLRFQALPDDTLKALDALLEIR